MVVNGLSGFDEGPPEVNLAARVLYGIAMAELGLPHIVVTRSTESGETTYSGPYATGPEALAAADVEWQLDRDAGGRGDLSFRVAAIYPPLEDSGERPEPRPSREAAVVAPDPDPAGPASRPRKRPRAPRTGGPLARRLTAVLEGLRAQGPAPCRQCGCPARSIVQLPRASRAGSPSATKRQSPGVDDR
jgi:hypothetical protein